MLRLFGLTALTMVAFAANSLLNRAALVDGGTTPMAFAAVRVVAGALVLVALVATRNGLPKSGVFGRAVGAGSLVVYLLGFSFAYIALDAGLGALILFGVVQVTMFVGAILSGERLPAARWIGAVAALLGLAWLVWPSEASAPLSAVLLMTGAAVGWGVYSLAGRGASDALGETAANFVFAAPPVLLVWVLMAGGVDARGLVLGVISGALTSGLGYALWYSVLPTLDRTVAALAQLTVPVIAVLGGVLFLGEAVTGRLVLASLIILGGVALGVIAPVQRTSGSRGS